jgi:26S proteasome regulatory subunit N7
MSVIYNLKLNQKISIMDLAFTAEGGNKKRGPSKQWSEKEIEEQLKKLD